MRTWLPEFRSIGAAASEAAMKPEMPPNRSKAAAMVGASRSGARDSAIHAHTSSDPCIGPSIAQRERVLSALSR